MKKQRVVFTPEMEQQLRDLRAKGATAKEAAAALGIAKNTAANRMARLPAPGPHQQLQVKLKQAGVKIPESAEIITPATVKIQRHICIPPDYAPICAASVQGQYTGAGLTYRGQAKR